MHKRYILNLIQANIEALISQLEDNKTFLPDSEEAGTTENYTATERKIIMMGLQASQVRLKETLVHLDRCTIKENLK